MQFFKPRKEFKKCLASEKNMWPLSTKFSPLVPATFLCNPFNSLQWHSQRSLPYGLLPLHTTISSPCLLWNKQGTINYYTTSIVVHIEVILKLPRLRDFWLTLSKMVVTGSAPQNHILSTQVH